VRKLLRAATRGGVAGLAATAAMSAFLIGMERIGILPGQPPRMIVDRFAPALPHDMADAAALAAHAAYGAFAGAAFAAATAGRAATQVLGMGYGLLVWAGGYEGWVPAMGVLPPAHRDRPSRAGTMIAAHLIYGFVLGRQLARR
jgi:hypothetical protein